MTKITITFTENEANQLIDALVYASLDDEEYSAKQREGFTKIANRVRDAYMARNDKEQ